MKSEPMFAFGACNPKIFANEALQVTTMYSITASARSWRDGTTSNNTYIAYRDFTGTATTSGSLHGVALEPTTLDLTECLIAYPGEWVGGGNAPPGIDGYNMVGMVKKHNQQTTVGAVVPGGTYHSFRVNAATRWRLRATNGVAVCLFSQVVQNIPTYATSRDYILNRSLTGASGTTLFAPNPIVNWVSGEWSPIEYCFEVPWNCCQGGIIATVCNGVEYV